MLLKGAALLVNRSSFSIPRDIPRDAGDNCYLIPGRPLISPGRGRESGRRDAANGAVICWDSNYKSV